MLDSANVETKSATFVCMGGAGSGRRGREAHVTEACRRTRARLAAEACAGGCAGCHAQCLLLSNYEQGVAGQHEIDALCGLGVQAGVMLVASCERARIV